MNELVTLSRDGDIAVITIQNPPVNALGPGVPEGIRSSIAAAAGDPAVHAIVVIGGGRTFIAGADIREFGKVVSGEKPRGSLLPMLLEIEDCPKPVVMAIEWRPGAASNEHGVVQTMSARPSSVAVAPPGLLTSITC